MTPETEMAKGFYTASVAYGPMICGAEWRFNDSERPLTRGRPR